VQVCALTVMPRSRSTSSLSCRERRLACHISRRKGFGIAYEDLLVIVRFGYRASEFQEPVAERALAMVDVRHDTEVSVSIERDGSDALFELARGRGAGSCGTIAPSTAFKGMLMGGMIVAVNNGLRLRPVQRGRRDAISVLRGLDQPPQWTASK
jgi:hypothetical protein